MKDERERSYLPSLIIFDKDHWTGTENWSRIAYGLDNNQMSRSQRFVFFIGPTFLCCKQKEWFPRVSLL